MKVDTSKAKSIRVGEVVEIYGDFFVVDALQLRIDETPYLEMKHVSEYLVVPATPDDHTDKSIWTRWVTQGIPRSARCMHSYEIRPYMDDCPHGCVLSYDSDMELATIYRKVF